MEPAFSAATVLRSIVLFIWAGLLEIGGGYLVWLWLGEGLAFVIGMLGCMILFIHGVVDVAAAHFGRVYAAHGDMVVVLSLLWGWRLDGTRPDRADVIGAALCIIGVAVIMYWPRTVPQCETRCAWYKRSYDGLT